jgi:hypothetical protein
VGVAATLVGATRVGVGARVGVLPGTVVPGVAAVVGDTAVAGVPTLVGADSLGSSEPRRWTTSLSGGNVGASTAVGVAPGTADPAGGSVASWVGCCAATLVD